jgi:competence protein ComEC
MRTLWGALGKRPLLVAGVCFALGVWLGVAAHAPLWVWLTGCALAAALCLVFRRGKAVLLIFIAVLVLCAGAARAGLDYPPDYAKIPDGEVTLHGRVAAAPEMYGGATVLILDTASVAAPGGQQTQLGGRVRLRVDGESKAPYGSDVTARARVSVPDGASYPGDFDYRMYLLGQGIWYTARADAADVAFGGAAAWYDPLGWAASVRAGISGAAEALYPEDVRSAILGILTGGHAGMESGDYQAFRDTGIAHVLSVSGLHVGFIVAGLVAVLGLLRMNKRLQWWLLAAILGFYCLVVGGQPPVLRASVMALALLYGRMHGYRQDGLNTLALALLIVLLLNPLDWFSTGLLLSFSAALGIVLLQRPITGALKRLPRLVRESVAVCLAAQMGMLPVMITAFNSVSVVSVLANLVFIPLFAVMVAAGWAGMLLYAVWQVLALPFAFVCTRLMQGVLFCVRALAELPFAAYNTVSWPLWLGVLWTVLLWAVSAAGGLAREGKLRVAATAGLCAALLLLGGLILPERLKVVMLDVGQAESIVIRTPDRRTYLVDCGAPFGAAPYEDSAVTAYLLKNGVDRLEGVFITHADADHTAELDVVTQVFRPRWVAFSEGVGQGFDLRGVQKETVSSGDRLELGGGADARVVYASGGVGNEAALLFVLEYGDFSMLFTGDAGTAEEQSALQSVGQADVLKAGHHGSGASTSAALLDAIKPAVAVISADGEAYGLPDAEVLRRLAARGIDVYRTDRDGCIETVADKDSFTVRGLGQKEGND